ncbi:uncharacterized protein LOC134079061 [Sardina pilchardus]|uniref:uncharacterized protein LOC134079061 n=1 Tax=Sardina pilchardus TaxID=27697 RepID=UPI002E133982
MSASVPAHKSDASVTPDHQLEAPLGQSDAPVTPDNVLEVLLGQSAELSCQLQLPPAVLKDSCIYVQTKDTRKKNPLPMFVTGPEKEVEVIEKVLLYLRRGQEKMEDQSPLYQNRTQYLGGADVKVKLLNVSVSDNNTIFQCVVCLRCWKCERQTEITLRTQTRTDEEGGNGSPTVPVAVAVSVPVLVVVGIVIVICLVCIRKQRSKSDAGANQSSQDAAEGGAIAVVENGVVDTPTEREGNQNQPDESMVMTQSQPNGSVRTTPDQLNGPAEKSQQQQHQHQQQSGSAEKNHQQQQQHQQSGSAEKSQQQHEQHQQSGSAESTAAPEQEPLLRNGHSGGEEDRGGQREQETCL